MMLKEYVGHLHLHSTYSDGTETIETIASLAREARLDFIGLNDHFRLEALHDGHEGWRDGVAVMIGCELNDIRNHYLAYNIAREVPNDALRPQSVIDGVRAQGGLGFLAHPFERSSPLWDKGRTFVWTDWQARDFTGMEIWNFCSLWRANSPNLPVALYRYHNLRAACFDPLPETIAKWDELSRERRIVAIGGSDNHGFRSRTLMGLFPVRLFDYRVAFRSVHTHVLLRDEMPKAFGAAKAAIIDALASGRCFVALHLFDDPRGFRFMAETATGVFTMGDEVPLSAQPVLRIHAPAESAIRVLCDGNVVAKSQGRSAEMRVNAAGSYRVEVRRRRGWGRTYGWIYSNAIRVNERTRQDTP